MPTIDYKEDFLMKDLQDLDRAAEYLTAAIEEGEDVFLLAVRDVVEAMLVIRKTAAAETAVKAETAASPCCVAVGE